MKLQKSNTDAGKRGYDRSYYEEETVADAIGKMINDQNLTRSIALKMSHPLLAKIHDVLLKIKNALMATPYTDDVKGIIRTIEQVYVKTANGTFESSASEGTNNEQFSVRDANERFNNEIENFKNKSHKGLLHLGTPSPILKACGVDVDEITLSPKVLNRKLNQHSLTTEDVKDLVNAIQWPIMVYKHGEEAPNIVVITNADIRGNKLSLSLELDADGNVTKLNNVSSIHDKDAETEINRWLSWDEGYLEKALRWVDKEKVSDWLSSARLNSYSQTENNQKLSSIAKILNDFENPNISEENISNDDENVSYSLRQKPEPEKKGIGYKVFVLGKDGKLYPPMVANPNGAATPVGVWLDADAAPIAGESKTGRPQVKQGGKGTQGGSGKLAYRPGWHLGVIPYAIQFNRKDAEGNKTLFPKNFVFAEVEYAADKDYQDEAHAEGINGNGNYQHSLAGLKHLPTDGYYMYRTNPNPETDPWVITGAMKVNRLLTRAEQADIVRKAGREPQKIQDGDIVTDDVVNSINQEIAAAPKFSVKSNVDNQGNPLNQDGTLKLEKIKSVDELTDEDFLHPTRNVELPSLPKKIADAIGTEGKPVVIKKNIFERNYMRHKDVTPELSKKIFKSALYNPDLYGQNQKKTRPYNWVLINTKDEKGNNRTVLLEVNPNKHNVEIVHWHFIDERGLKKIRKQVDREDGQLLILPSDKEEVGALSDPTVNLSAANIANPSETSKGNAEKFSLRLQDAINETDTEPTEAQKKSGNYKKGHVKFGGYDYTIENPKGSYRSGVDENGKGWKQKMNDTYGYIRGKFGKDGDHLDMFINDNADLDNWNGDVFVVDQVNPDGKFDEHKVMYGYDSLEEAKKAYLSNYEKGWTGLGNITPVSKAGFDKWLDRSNRKLKPFADYADITSKTDIDTAPRSFEEFLDVVRYSIRNEKERAAAEDAYNFAQENRPDKYSRYAIVNMEKPGAVPQYLEKKTAADNWRRYYNKLKWGNYKLFDLDKPFEDNVKNLVGKFPETFRKKNDNTLSKINELTADYNKRKEEYDAMSNSIQELLNGLMKQGRSLAEAESVIRDWGLYKEMDSKYQNLMGIRKQLNELRSGKVADGERYSLIGKKGAANLDHEEEVSTRLGNLNVARQMENTKKDAKAIKMATGWERGADGKWRYEIPDAKLSDMTDIDGKGTMVKRNTEDMLWTSGKLGDKVDAPSLFKAYPDLKDVRLETDAITNGLPSNGSFNPKINTITIHANNLKYLNSILNHEIQHAIQMIEGFAKGGSPEMFHDPSESDRLYTKFDNFVKRIYGNSDVKTLYGILDGVTDKDKEFVKVLGDKYSRILESLRAAKKYTSTKFFKEIYDRTVKEGAKPSAFKQYQALAGEVESRNVQSRMGMSPEERRKTLAEETEDVARKDQIFLYGDNDAYSLKQDKDAEYLEAVKNGDMENAQKMVYDAARAAGYVNGTDYQGEGSWNAPSASVEKKDFANLDALRESVEEYSGDTNVFGIINGVTTNDDDFYYNPGRVGFRDAAASETSSVLRRLRYDKADANTKVKVYRTVPADVKGNKLMSGDWIALSKQYCIEHGNGRYGEGGYRIIEEEVPIKTIWNDGNDMREFGFDDGNNNEAEKNVPNNRKLLDRMSSSLYQF